MIRMPEDKHRVALVTGASQGIGLAIARALMGDGIACILVGRSLEKLNEVVAGLGQLQDRATCMQADIAVSSDIEKLAETVAAISGRLDILVNCAGIFAPDSWAETAVDQLDRIYETNVRGAYALTSTLLPMLVASRGDVVFVNSSVVHSNGNMVGQYAASKHALTGLADSLRAEINPDGVRVLTVYPGRTATPMQETLVESEGGNYVAESLLQPSDVADVIVACLKLPATAEVTEVRIRPRMPPR